MKTTIYALADKDGGIFYIGRSANIDVRFKQHIYNSKKKSNATEIKINELKGDIKLIILEEVIGANDTRRERYWIKRYSKKHTLTNKTGFSGDVDLPGYIKIDKATYDRAYKYCKERGIFMGRFCEKAIEREIATLKNPHEVIYR